MFQSLIKRIRVYQHNCKQNKYNYGRNKYLETFKSIYQNLLDKEAKLESTYDFTQTDAFYINIWDEIEDDGSTYLYLEDASVPSKISSEVLIFIMNFARNNEAIINTGVEFNIHYYNSMLIYPDLVDTRFAGVCSHQWQIILSNVTGEKIDIITQELNTAKFNGIRLNAYSES